MSVADGLSA